jgi:hypothetical protein
MHTTLYRSVALSAALSCFGPASVIRTVRAGVGKPGGTVFNGGQLDALLAQVLMATTYPQRVVDACRWLDIPASKSLTGGAVPRSLAEQNWDPSVKSLVPFPQVLGMLNSKLD